MPGCGAKMEEATDLPLHLVQSYQQIREESEIGLLVESLPWQTGSVSADLRIEMEMRIPEQQKESEGRAGGGGGGINVEREQGGGGDDA